MNFGSSGGLNRQGDKLTMLKKSVEDSIDQQKTQLSLNQVFHKFKPVNQNKIKMAKKNKDKNTLKNNSPWGL